MARLKMATKKMQKLVIVEEPGFASGYKIVVEGQEGNSGIPASPYNLVLWQMYMDACERIKSLEKLVDALRKNQSSKDGQKDNNG